MYKPTILKTTPEAILHLKYLDMIGNMNATCRNEMLQRLTSLIPQWFFTLNREGALASLFWENYH
jgi:hypothetical protein